MNRDLVDRRFCLPAPKKGYVLLFAFSEDLRDVVLIHKARPAWMAGKRNGLGGQIEPPETPVMAASREFREECGVEVEPDRWRSVACLRSMDYDLWVYACTLPEVAACRTTTDEQVYPVPYKCLFDGCAPNGFLYNTPWLAAMAHGVLAGLDPTCSAGSIYEVLLPPVQP